ncbi:MAG: alpha-galactosidase [Clostridia bacterium]|nr:alpha-galactosidase [Clostridia bacterium]
MINSYEKEGILMFSNAKVTVNYKANGKVVAVTEKNEDLSYNFSFDGKALKLSLIPSREIELVNAKVVIPYSFPDNVRIMPNGYQSWTRTREYKKDEKYKGMNKLVKSIPLGFQMAGCSGDYMFREYPDASGIFHGYTYSYIRTDEKFTLIGSLSEQEGYTVLNFDANNNLIIVEKDLEAKVTDKEILVLDAVVLNGGHDEVFDEYFTLMGIEKPKTNRINGYTSWYNYYTDITEEIIIRDLEALKATGADINIFQIDDGYQSFIGDWETPNKKFPKGMKYIADEIHSKGWLAGLWLAPFYIQKNSVVAKEHPEWIVKTPDGKPLYGFVGLGRDCYTLDFYNPECAAYIKQFFNTILNTWGFDMVKLDFLYTACIVPRNGKSRGEIMCDAMSLLRECVGEKLILGCGVPLGPAFGKVDYCRIGSDVDLTFKPVPVKGNVNREIVSVQTAIKNTIFRRGLNGRVFGNDPDVFYLRNALKEVEGDRKSKKDLKFTWEQRVLWADLCRNLGTIIFTSDNAANYDKKQSEELMKTYSAPTVKVLDAIYEGDNCVKLTCEESGKKFEHIINWNTGENSKKDM